jgi:hypothetical protein
MITLNFNVYVSSKCRLLIAVSLPNKKALWFVTLNRTYPLLPPNQQQSVTYLEGCVESFNLKAWNREIKCNKLSQNRSVSHETTVRKMMKTDRDEENDAYKLYNLRLRNQLRAGLPLTLRVMSCCVWQFVEILWWCGQIEIWVASTLTMIYLTLFQHQIIIIGTPTARRLRYVLFDNYSCSLRWLTTASVAIYWVVKGRKRLVPDSVYIRTVVVVLGLTL